MTIRSFSFCKSLMASLVLAIFVSAPVAAQTGNNQAMVDLVVQVQQLQDEVRRLTGIIEDQAIELDNLSTQQRDRYLDLDRRINELRSAGPRPVLTAPVTRNMSGSVTTAGATPASQSVTTTREELPEVRDALDTPSAVTGLASPQTTARDLPPSPEAEKEAYDQAFESLKNLRYADSAEQFQSFLTQYPDSDYADNAQYWLGESYYVTRNYDIALEAFQGLIRKYPNSPKIADGLLKIGYTHYELKQWDQARAALVQVQEQYPDTTLARLAGSRLRSMKLEGHY